MKNKGLVFLMVMVLLFSSFGWQQQGVMAASKTPVERYGQLSVSGTKLVGADGKTVQLKGVSTHGLSWYPQYVSKATFQSLRDEWGVNVIRLAMYTGEYNGYCTGDGNNRIALRKKIGQAVKYASQLGMYVIIDWHILSDGNPATYEKQSARFFKIMAKKYGDHKNVLYEICNEPNGGTTWSQIKSYSKKILKVIRKYDSDGIVIVGTPTWSQDVDQAAASPIAGYKNVMYGFHFYAATHTDTYRTKLQNAIDAGLPVFVTEYGICDASGSGAINKTQAAKWMQLLNRNKVSSCIWNLSNKSETSALIKSSCNSLSHWKASQLSASGKWFVKMMKKNLDSLPD